MSEVVDLGVSSFHKRLIAMLAGSSPFFGSVITKARDSQERLKNRMSVINKVKKEANTWSAHNPRFVQY